MNPKIFGVFFRSFNAQIESWTNENICAELDVCDALSNRFPGSNACISSAFTKLIWSWWCTNWYYIFTACWITIFIYITTRCCNSLTSNSTISCNHQLSFHTIISSWFWFTVVVAFANSVTHIVHAIYASLICFR